MDASDRQPLSSHTSPTAAASCATQLINASIGEQLSLLIKQLEPPTDAELLIQGAYAAVEGGKRIRGRGVYIGSTIATNIVGPHQPSNQKAVDILAAAVELYQASALVHDDLIDHALTRRNHPTFTVILDEYHHENQWTGSPQEFATAGSILLGDFLLSAADYALVRVQQILPPTISTCITSRFTFMHSEVALGQYLDVSLQHKPLDPHNENAINVSSCLEIMKRKSARYSVVHPVAIGMMTSEVPHHVIGAVEKVLEPWGIAFQLRDDQLGVFGKPETTGKPAGDDIREGKRTALLAITWKNATFQEKRILAQGVGNPDINDRQLAHIEEIMNHRGNGEHETLISSMLTTGDQFLAKTSDLVEPDALKELHYLRDTLTYRQS